MTCSWMMVAGFMFAAMGSYHPALERPPHAARMGGHAVIIASGILAMRVEKREQVEEAGFEN